MNVIEYVKQFKELRNAHHFLRMNYGLEIKGQELQGKDNTNYKIYIYNSNKKNVREEQSITTLNGFIVDEKGAFISMLPESIPSYKGEKISFQNSKLEEKVNCFKMALYYFAGKWRVETEENISENDFLYKRITLKDALAPYLKGVNLNDLDKEHIYILGLVDPEMPGIDETETPRLYLLGMYSKKYIGSKSFSDEMPIELAGKYVDTRAGIFGAHRPTCLMIKDQSTLTNILNTCGDSEYTLIDEFGNKKYIVKNKTKAGNTYSECITLIKYLKHNTITKSKADFPELGKYIEYIENTMEKIVAQKRPAP